MADTQIANLQSVAAPSDYVLPSSVELQLKAVNAELDGSSALGSWLPAVEIISDAGQVIARAVDSGSPVAAGASAEVSWFPGVKHATSASVATAFPWIRRRKLAGVNQNVLTATEPVVTWNSIVNDYPAVFQANGDGIKVLQDGLYSIVSRLYFVTTPTNADVDVYLNGIDSDGFGRYPTGSGYPLFSQMAQGSTVARLANGQTIYVTCRQQSGSTYVLDGNDGSYLELRRLGDVTTHDNFG